VLEWIDETNRARADRRSWNWEASFVSNSGGLAMRRVLRRVAEAEQATVRLGQW
jgi:hypothetical protein